MLNFKQLMFTCLILLIKNLRQPSLPHQSLLFVYGSEAVRQAALLLCCSYSVTVSVQLQGQTANFSL